jgi:hypothetical protein
MAEGIPSTIQNILFQPLPVPLQVGHMIFLSPPHELHGLLLTFPDPLHTGQSIVLLLLHVLHTAIFLSLINNCLF